MNEISAAVVDKPPAVPGPAKPPEAPEGAPRHVFLIDGSGFIFRAYHALRAAAARHRTGRRPRSLPGFSNMLGKLGARPTPTTSRSCSTPRAAAFRNRLYDQYKAHRPPPPEDLVPQFAHVREATEAFGIRQIELDGFEADDLIATYARHAAEGRRQR